MTQRVANLQAAGYLNMRSDKILRKINYRPNYTRLIIICMIIISFLAGRLLAESRAVINEYTDKVSAFYNIPPEILPAIIMAESSYRINPPYAGRGAYGIMQVTRGAYKDYYKLNPNTYITNYQIVKTDWRANIAVGAWYLKYRCYKKAGNWKGAITKYFWGPWNNDTTMVYYRKVKQAIDG